MGFITPDAPCVQLHLPAGAVSICPLPPLQPLLAPPAAAPSIPQSYPAVLLPSPTGTPFPSHPTHLPAPERRPPPTVPRAEALAPGMPRATSRLSSRRASRSGFPLNLLTSPVTPEACNHIPLSRAREAAGLFPACSAGGLAPLHPLSWQPQPWRLQFPASTGPRRRGLLPGPTPRLGPAPGRRSLRANSVARIWDLSRAARVSGCDA